ncbi:hypothetical protein [uncultured Gammaproteobacteria bacterium]|nr:hypothetical protein [uncultured Gammaproteobacteria bacterium]CAC9611719.1 hypothetical protein [uncultured Gammaproteobacteria bacterium]CAC9615027.1 hypothetical protein [uncultured Gammaproteobacteria bacterium]
MTVDHVAKNFFRADINAWLSIIDDLNDSRLDSFKKEMYEIKEEYDKKIEFTNNNNGLRKLYDKLEWEWDRD